MPELASGEVHVWLQELDGVAPGPAELSADERERAARLRRPLDRDRWIMGRAGLRQLLGRYLERAPSSLVFAYDERGKPSLAPPQHGVVFNRSNSGSRAVVAVATQGHLGVDLEEVSDEPDHEALAQRFFAPSEARWVAAAPPSERPDRFFRMWTAKEAVVKALGAGFTMELDRFEITLEPDLRLIRTTDGSSPADWSLAFVDVGSGFSCALAVWGARFSEIRVLRDGS